jgi:cyanophycin synthetase
MGRAIDAVEVFADGAAVRDLTLRPLRVEEVAVYRGPHLYSATPMIRMQIDLGALEAWPTNKLGVFTEDLLALLPTLDQHGCSAKQRGGFVARMRDGTWLGHVIEHVALELQSLAGMPVTRGKTRSVPGRDGVYNVMYAYKTEEAGLCAGRLAIECVASLIPDALSHVEGLDSIFKPADGPFDLASGLQLLRDVGRRSRLGPTTGSIVSEAVRRGIPWQRLDEHSFIQLGTGRYQRRLRGSISAETRYLAVEVAGDKDLTKQLLGDAGVPVPRGRVVVSAEEAIKAARAIGAPVVLKPLNANHGRGVSTNLSSSESIVAAFEIARAHGRRVVVEQFYPGRDHRILVVNGEVVAVAERRPASVTGNGRDTVRQLIEQLNADPRRGEGHEDVMTRVKVDDAILHRLAAHGLTLETVPDVSQEVILCATANISTGGMAVDKTDVIHPDNAEVAVQAARVIGLDIAGIDMVMPDISRSYKDVGGGVVEVNASPGLRMHIAPAEGKPRNPAKAIVRGLFPKGAQSSVPLAAVTGTNGKSTTVRMVAEILSHGCSRVGFTSTSGIFVNGQSLWKGDASGPQSAKRLLRDPELDYAVLETARGGILREGLSFESCDVGAVLNVSEDHLGLKGINTVADLAAVKSVVTESVRRGGVSVLNADDALTHKMARHAGGRICFFSMHSVRSRTLAEHIRAGGLAVTREFTDGKGEIVVHEGERRIPIIPVDSIPACMNGLADFNVQNALAAAAITHGLGVPFDQIRRGLAGFSSTFEQNPGRMNIHDGHGFRVIMDYAHNPAALSAFLRLIDLMRAHHGRVIGHVSTPGDRRESDIRQMGAIAARSFDHLVFRELPDNRGRPSGEVVRLLTEGARDAGFAAAKITSVLPEEEATALCLQMAKPGDLVILMPTGVEACWRQVLAFKPRDVRRDASDVQTTAFSHA